LFYFYNNLIINRKVEQMVKKSLISIIVAIADNWAIGKNNELLFHIPGDLPRFKKITTGHTVIMGRNTFLSLPKGALPNRTNIVISDNLADNFKGCVMASSIEDALLKISDNEQESFVIGGGMIYRQFLPIADKLYLTRVHLKPDADTFFPEIDFNLFKMIENEEFTNDNLPNTYEIWKKII
jgi:dihydrofolate reductase